MMPYSIDLVLDQEFYELGIYNYIQWQYIKYPHMVIFGSTGSGKTYLLKIILARIGLTIPDSELLVCDFKADNDFNFLSNYSNFYRFDNCSNGLKTAIEILRNRQTGKNNDSHFFMLVFDEWASFINSLEKKQAEQAKQDLSSLLMLGRSFNIHVLLSQQRLDASYFSSARDNFSVVIGMGKLSKESVEMMFSDYKKLLIPNKTQGTGSLIMGNKLKNIIVPSVNNPKKLEHNIIKAVNRTFDTKSM